ncbi:hypothetical protein [Hyalangium gracile]|uniref:hypothetical protein n=1 Tax=Hyalangium gracile TaxID=394092 RepID=UPI001CCD6C18|nr:hypothetical protein [Hyalangium gracile]
MRGVILLLVTLTASLASAQDDYAPEDYEVEENKRLEGTSRISIMGGWRYAPNLTFYDNYYLDRDNRGLERSRGSIGGPLVTGTFGYSVNDFIEVGIDLFATYERMVLTNKPGLNTATYGALVGLRFQKRLELGRQVVIPSAGVLVGPLIAAAYFDGGRAVERGGQALGFSAGATMRLSQTWGLSFEFRQLFAGGDAEDVGSYNAGGSWLSVGMTYVIPWQYDEKKIRGRL